MRRAGATFVGVLFAAAVLSASVGGRRDASEVAGCPAAGEKLDGGVAGFVTLACSVTVYAEAGEVWRVLTSSRRFALWCPYWGVGETGPRTLRRPGDTLSFYLRGERVGRSVVTRCDSAECFSAVHEAGCGDVYGLTVVSLRGTDSGTAMIYSEIVRAAECDPRSAREQVCKRAFKIKRLAEGE